MMFTLSCVCGGVGETALLISLLYVILGYLGIKWGKKGKGCKHGKKEEEIQT